MSAPVAVVGAGEFGRGLAKAVARTGRDAILWSRTKHDGLGERVHTTHDLSHVGDAELVFLAVPSAHVPQVIPELGARLDGSHLVVHVSRGLIGDDLEPITRYIREHSPVRRVGALAGPLVAEALDSGANAGGIVATRFPEIVDVVRDSLAGPTMRLFATDDVAGVESASALVGLLLVGAGIARGIGVGPSPLSVFLTRGLAEVARVGCALGGSERTFWGMAGMGDLLAAVASDDRPEIHLGRALAKGETAAQAEHEVHAHVEAVSLGKRVASFAFRKKLDAPVLQAVAGVIAGDLKPADAVAELMARKATRE